MKIEKYVKKKNGMYQIVLDGSSFMIHEDLILKYGLLLKKDLSSDDFLELEQENLKYQVYEVGLKFLKSRLSSKKELYDKLVKKGFSDDIVKDSIDLLEKQGYLNDAIYLESYIHDKIMFSSDGPLKIKKNLLMQDVSSELIDDKLNGFTEELEEERLNKIIQKSLKQNTKSLSAFQNKMKYHCASLGYHEHIISSVLSNISFDDSSLLEKEYDKLYKKLSSKYQGKELEHKIKQKLYQKGFRT